MQKISSQEGENFSFLFLSLSFFFFYSPVSVELVNNNINSKTISKLLTTVDLLLICNNSYKISVKELCSYMPTMPPM